MLGGVYVAYPIDQRGDVADLQFLFNQIERFKRALVDLNLVKWVFDPGDAFTVSMGAEPDDSLPRINRAALINSDLVVAFLPKHTPSVGVPIEIDRARAMGKHVMVFSDASAWMLEMPQVWRANGFEDDHLEAGMEWVTKLEPNQFPGEKYLELRVVGDQAMMPSRTYEDDAGLDLYVSEDTVIAPGTFSDVPCGISCELPEGTWGLITGRSSALRKRGLLVHSGVIDVGYRGPLFAGAWNMTDEKVALSKGERIAQLIVLSNTTRRVAPVRVDELSTSKRGLRGFGSTGE